MERARQRGVAALPGAFTLTEIWLGGPLVGDAGEGGDLRSLRRRTDAAVAQVREARAR